LSSAEHRARQTEILLQLSELRVKQLEEQLRLLRIQKYGPAGESLSAAQLAMFEDELSATLDEAAAEASREPMPEVPPARPRQARKPHPGRQELPAELPRVEETVACEPAQCVCGACGAATEVIGYESSERLDVEPAKFFVTVTKREKRACPRCKQGGVKTAPAPARIVEKGIASDRVVIDTVVAKYCDHLPLYRQSAMLLRDAKVEIGRATLDGWVLRVGELLGPIAQAMRREILARGYIQADETAVDVQRHREKKGRNHQGYLWQTGNPDGMTVFHFALGRGGAVARELLGGFRGLLQTDGYTAYDGVSGSGVVHAGCWAHARRYFVDAVKLNGSDALAREMAERIDALFAIERRAREAKITTAERRVLREEESAPKVEALRVKLEAIRHQVLPKSQMGKGVAYTLGQWSKLVRFLEHAELELSNNLAENSMRGAVLGRKNWLHIGSAEAGPKVAAILSVVESCKRLGVPVREYLGAVLPGLAGRKISELPALTPEAWRRARREAA
jgi:transposase